MGPLLLTALLLYPAPARAEDAKGQVQNTSLLSGAAAGAGDATATHEAAARPFDGNLAADTTVIAPGQTRASSRLAKPTPAEFSAKIEPPLGVEKKSDEPSIKTGIMMAGSGALGALQGWFTAGLVGAAAGLGLGLAAAWLFHKKDYGGAFGVTAGAIIGTAFGGPIGGLVGAVVGGILGHFLGKLFL